MNCQAVVTIIAAAAAAACGASDAALAAWIDSQTGQPVQVEPYVDPHTGGRNYDYQSGHATYHGHNLFWDTQCGTWRDSANGAEIEVEPYIDPHTGGRNYGYQSGHATYHAHNLFWQPCPPPDQPASVQPVPVLPLLPFSLGLGHRDHGDDQFRK
jgi:hypothetical protein